MTRDQRRLGPATRTSPPDAQPIDRDLLHEGARELQAIGALVGRSDPGALLTPRSALLCAALARVARDAHAHLGGQASADAVVRVASLLSLLTKLDDQVIDAPAFHGGAATARALVRRRTRTFLAPTLASIRAGRPTHDEPRCLLAAELGRLARAHGDEARWQHWLDRVAHGWSVQVEAVAVFTAHPSTVELRAVSRVTAAITGAWFRMLVLCATLDPRVQALTPEEEAAFDLWGAWLQRADALADLAKDSADGHLSTVPGHLLWQHLGQGWLDRVHAGEHAEIYAAVARHDVDLACLPTLEALQAGRRALTRLPRVRDLLEWVLGMLLFRYLHHPCSARDPRHPAFLALLPDPASYRRFLTGRGPGDVQEAACSER